MNTRKFVDEAAEKVFKNTRDKGKRNRTLSLHDESFQRLQEYCNEQSLSVSSLIDEFIAAFLREVELHTQGKSRTKSKGER